MRTMEGRVHIKRPVEEVFAFVADQNNIPRWQPKILGVEQQGSGPLGMGTLVRYRSANGTFGDWSKVITFERNRRLEFIDGAEMGLLQNLHFTPEQNGTRVTWRCAMSPPKQWALKFVFDSMFSEVLRRAMTESLSLLKAALEGPGPVAKGTVVTREVGEAGAAAAESPGAEQADGGRRYATASLVAANLVPLVGVLLLGWDVGTVVLLYWAENLIAGFYTVLRMATVGAPPMAKVLMIPFFLFHYGMFCTVHGMFVVGMFHLDPVVGSSSGNPLRLLWVVMLLPGMSWSLLALWVSHGISFIENHWLRGERGTANIVGLMMRPYSRMIVLHIAIIVGGLLAAAIETQAWMLAVLVALKLGIDYRAHRRALWR